MTKTCGPYRVLSVRPEYLKTLHGDVQSYVNINLFTRVTEEGDTSDQPLTKTGEPETTSQHPANELKNNNNMEQYTFELIVWYVTTRKGPHYVVHEYSTSTKHNNVKLL